MVLGFHVQDIPYSNPADSAAVLNRKKPGLLAVADSVHGFIEIIL